MTHSDDTTPPAAITRRTVIKGAAAAAASGPLILGCATPMAAASDPEVLRIGLIGCGGRGTGAAFNALNAEQGGTVRLVAMADVFSDRLESSHKHLQESLGEERAHLADVDAEHRFVGFGAAQQLIDSDVDVVLLATPPHFRPAHLRAAITAGKHVFTEKPMAVDAQGVHSVLETAALAKQKNLSLVSGFCWRYNNRHRAFYARVHDGALGEIRAVHSVYNASPLGTNKRQDGWSDMEWQLRNWQHFNWLSGDHVVEQAVHSIDKMNWAMNNAAPLSVTAIGGRQAREGAERGDIYDHFAATFEYGGGVKGFHMSRQMANCSSDVSDHIFGELGHGSIVRGGWGDNDHKITGPRAWTYSGPANDMYQTEHDELFASIRDGRPINNGEFMARSTMLAIMVRMSAYTGQTLTWEQATGSTRRLGPETYAFGDIAMPPVPVPGKTPFV